jgi:hypothetical protein
LYVSDGTGVPIDVAGALETSPTFTCASSIRRCR